MGESVSKLQIMNSCVNNEETPNIQRYHFKCRHNPDDEFCLTNVYTRTKDTFVRLFILMCYCFCKLSVITQDICNYAQCNCVFLLTDNTINSIVKLG